MTGFGKRMPGEKTHPSLLPVLPTHQTHLEARGQSESPSTEDKVDNDESRSTQGRRSYLELKGR